MSKVIMPSENKSVTLFSPAKINLFLAITGLRADGFHELVSLVAPVAFGDSLEARLLEEGAEHCLECNDSSVPLNEDNLILRAAARFVAKSGCQARFHFSLDKKIPIGAGLGGGSSNASTALKAMNQLVDEPLPESVLLELAAELGSDCPLFLKGIPVLMRGRGEVLETLSREIIEVLSGASIIIFKPGFSISTAWAYGQLKAGGGAHYYSEREIKRQFDQWSENPSLLNLPLVNNMQDVSFKKFLALPALLEQLRNEFGLKCMMSGSGSACFGILENEFDVENIERAILNSWGEDAFIVKTKIT